jgi:hypothetical protein
MLSGTKLICRWVVLAGGLVVLATESDGAISVELAKKCRAMAIKAHPTVLYGSRARSATSQREYYNECVAREGDMPDQSTGSTKSDK